MSPSRSRTALSAASLFFGLITSAAAATNPLVPKGCFGSAGELSENGAGYYMYQSSGYCQQQCLRMNKAVMAMTKGTDCYCGDTLPPKDSQVADYECSVKCAAWDEPCGGTDSWSVALTGIEDQVPFAAGGGSGGGGNGGVSSSGSSSEETVSVSQSTAVQPLIITVGGSTIVKTILPGPTDPSTPQPQAAAPSPSPSSGGSSTGSKVGIAVGVVVGVLALAALIAGVWLYMRKKRNEGHRHIRNSSFVGFSSQGSPPSSVTDSRLDATMVERRNSIGSVFADNEDYSRRILKVTNPGQ